jgi:hydrogenase nickel incorporation protein HypA/HybF
VHETSITESILSLALEKAKEANAERVTRINLVIGELSGVAGECVQQYFELLRENTIAGGAVLAIEKQSAVLKCRKCAKVFPPDDENWQCPDCREANVEIISGRDCYMESIEVE